MATMTTGERLAALEARVAASGVLLTEIHAAVVGDGSAGSSLRERVTALETHHSHTAGWKYRGVTTGATAVVSAALAYLAHALSVSTTR